MAPWRVPHRAVHRGVKIKTSSLEILKGKSPLETELSLDTERSCLKANGNY